MYKLLLVSALVFAMPAAEAANESQDAVFSADKGLEVNAAFEAQRAAIIAALGDGETYVEISPEDRDTVLGALSRIASTLGSVPGGVESLPSPSRMQVFNDQELVNTLLTRAREDSRLVCAREKKVGSHRHVNVCRTVADRRRDREGSLDTLRQGYGRERVRSN